MKCLASLAHRDLFERCVAHQGVSQVVLEWTEASEGVPTKGGLCVIQALR